MESTIKLIVGLGNPGSDYTMTRHNCGFLAIDALSSLFPTNNVFQNAYQGLFGQIRFQGNNIGLLKPMTWMNLSGESVLQAKISMKLTNQEILIIYDDLSLPLGSFRIRRSGSHGGHNGMGDILKKVGGENIPRLRIGIGSPTQNQIDYVLGSFTESEKCILSQTLTEVGKAVKLIIARGLGCAMNTYNHKIQEEKESSDLISQQP